MKKMMPAPRQTPMMAGVMAFSGSLVSSAMVVTASNPTKDTHRMADASRTALKSKVSGLKKATAENTWPAPFPPLT